MFRTWITRESVSITQLSGSKNFNFHIPQYSAILNWEPLKSCSIAPSKCLSLSFRRPAWGSFAFLGSRKFCLFVSVITGKSFFPNPIAKRFEQNFLQQNKKKKLRDSTKLKYFAERAKQNLSTSFNTKVEIYDVCCRPTGGDVVTSLSRDEFDQIVRPLLVSTMFVKENCLQEASVEKSEIDYVVLVGGCSKIPLLQSLV